MTAISGRSGPRDRKEIRVAVEELDQLRVDPVPLIEPFRRTQCRLVEVVAHPHLLDEIDGGIHRVPALMLAPSPSRHDDAAAQVLVEDTILPVVPTPENRPRHQREVELVGGIPSFGLPAPWGRGVPQVAVTLVEVVPRNARGRHVVLCRDAYLIFVEGGWFSAVPGRQDGAGL